MKLLWKCPRKSSVGLWELKALYRWEIPAGDVQRRQTPAVDFHHITGACLETCIPDSQQISLDSVTLKALDTFGKIVIKTSILTWCDPTYA